MVVVIVAVICRLVASRSIAARNLNDKKGEAKLHQSLHATAPLAGGN